MYPQYGKAGAWTNCRADKLQIQFLHVMSSTHDKAGMFRGGDERLEEELRGRDEGDEGREGGKWIQIRREG